MKTLIRVAVPALALAACDGGGEQAQPQANEAPPANTAEAPPTMPACPFRRTRGWGGAIEGGSLEVNGAVDFMMGGFRPTLTERPGAPAGTIAFDLTLEPAPNQPVDRYVHFERAGASGYRRGEIWCDDERIAEFDIHTID